RMCRYYKRFLVYMANNSKVYFPCKTNQQPDYDEVVVFSKTQILPRYLIYYKIGAAPQVSTSGTLPSPQSSLSSPTQMPLDIRDASGEQNLSVHLSECMLQ